MLHARNPHASQPKTPGEILAKEFLLPLGMTQKALADHVGCDIKVINRIVNGRTSVRAAMALKLAATFRTSPELWLDAQKAVDLYRAEREVRELPAPVVGAGGSRRAPDAEVAASPPKPALEWDSL